MILSKTNTANAIFGRDNLDSLGLNVAYIEWTVNMRIHTGQQDPVESLADIFQSSLK